MLMTVVAEQERDSIDGGQTDRSINDSGDECKIRSEKGSNQVEVKNTNQPPVETADNHQNEYDFFQSNHSFRMYFAPKQKKYDIIFISMRRRVEIFCRGKIDEH